MKEMRQFKGNRTVRSAFFIVPCLLLTVLSSAAIGADEKVITVRGGEAPGIESILKAVVAHNGQIQEAAQDVEIAQAQVERARAAMYPRGSTTFLAAPLFEERGNAIASTRNLSNWGPYLSSMTQIVQPIYTFGQIGGYNKAAEHQLIATHELARMKKNDVLYNAKDFFYTFQMASDFEKLTNNLSEFLGSAVTEAEKTKEKKSGVKPHDLNRLKIALDDLLQKKLWAHQGKMTANKAVLWMTGNTFDTLPATPLEPEPFEKKTLEEYLLLAKNHRPEFKALKAGQIARNALADAKQAQSYPTLFIGGMIDLNWSPVRDPQPSFYAQDLFNRMQGGVALGLRLDLEFSRHSAEAQEERAQAMKLKATESYAAPGIEVEVSRAFWELEQAVEGLEIAERRKKVGRKWFVGSAMGWSVGVTNPKELMEALEGDGLSRQNYIYTLYQYNAALAKLSKAVGIEITNLKY